MELAPGITPAGVGQDGVVWNVLGHTYFLKEECDASFSFETIDPPGTGVPAHVHPDQDEFIYVLEGALDLRLGDEQLHAEVGDLIRMPRGIPHAYFTSGETQARALFWVSPAGQLRDLFDRLHDLTDVEEVVRLSAERGVMFLPPEE
jgi:quercetin dioxygenase-like cupin family protein